MVTVRKATCHLYGKRGIRFLPAHPDHVLGPDELVIPGFAESSRTQWLTDNFLMVLAEAPWVLTDSEIVVCRSLQGFFLKTAMKAIGEGRSAPTGTSKNPKNSRQDLRQAAAYSSAAAPSESATTSGGGAGQERRQGRTDPQKVHLPRGFYKWIEANC